MIQVPRQRSQLLVVMLATLLASAGCGAKQEATTPRSADPAGVATADPTAATLYDRLGGKDAITAVVDDFVANVAADTRINARFANADIPRLKTMLVDQICEATGGPCKYTGKDMRTSHTGMKITEAEFNALVEDLAQALDKHKVGETEKSQLLGALGAMKGDIVGI